MKFRIAEKTPRIGSLGNARSDVPAMLCVRAELSIWKTPTTPSRSRLGNRIVHQLLSRAREQAVAVNARAHDSIRDHSRLFVYIFPISRGLEVFEFLGFERI